MPLLVRFSMLPQVEDFFTHLFIQFYSFISLRRSLIFWGRNTDILSNQRPKKGLSIPAFLLAPVFFLPYTLPMKGNFLSIEAPCTKCAGLLPHQMRGILPHRGAVSRRWCGGTPCEENGWLCQLKKSFHSEAAVYLLKFGRSGL
jgi:hypothetical protein